MPDETPPRDVVGRRVPAGHGRADEFTYTVVLIEPAKRPAVRMVDPLPGKKSRELRGDRRIRTRLHDGIIAEQRGRAVVDCRICDRSRTGARLQLDKDRPLPSRFLLTDVASRTQFWATLIWQAGRDAGVKLKPA